MTSSFWVIENMDHRYHYPQWYDWDTVRFDSAQQAIQHASERVDRFRLIEVQEQRSTSKYSVGIRHIIFGDAWQLVQHIKDHRN
jgi:hypothetical protein